MSYGVGLFLYITRANLIFKAHRDFSNCCYDTEIQIWILFCHLEVL